MPSNTEAINAALNRFQQIEHPFNSNALDVRMYTTKELHRNKMSTKRVLIWVTPIISNLKDTADGNECDVAWSSGEVMKSYCEWYEALVHRLTEGGGIGVVLYDVTCVEDVAGWRRFVVPFVECNLRLKVQYDDWLQRTYIYSTHSFVQDVLHVAFTIWKPSRPVTMCRTEEVLRDRVGRLWDNRPTTSAPRTCRRISL
jgi:hypothetical protein|tara:strand:- start:1994 stop:2590 length:597 start_codon:yes stop_codon:yes gene_type:complete